MRVDKTKTNKLLSLTKTLIPVMALSLTILSFGASASAASVTKSFVPYDMSTGVEVYNMSGGFISCPASGEIDTQQIGPADIISPSTTPFCLTGYQNASPQHNTNVGIYRIDNPCTITPVDITVNASATALKDTNDNMYAKSVSLDVGVGNFDSMDASSPDGPWSGLYDFIGNSIGMSPTSGYGLLHNNYDYTVPHSDSATLNATGITDPRIGVGISDYTQSGIGPYRVDTLTYTLTYPDGMADCAYPNQPPTISTATGSVNPSSPTDTVVVLGSSLNGSDPDNDTLAFSITAGNDESYFAVDPATGDISTTKTGIPVGTYTLTIQVDDGKGGLATETVTITVSEDAPITPNNTPGMGGSNKEAKLNDDKVLAKTGSNLSLIITLGLITSLGGLGLKRFAQLIQNRA